jgi:hypothetical protein
VLSTVAATQDQDLLAQRIGPLNAENLCELTNDEIKEITCPPAGITHYRLKDEIFRSPEIKDQLSRSKIEPMNFMNIGRQKKIESALVFDANNQTLEDILDELVVKSGIRVWV